MPGSSFTKSMDIVNQSNDTLLVYLRAEVGEEVYAEYLQTHPEEALSEAAYAEQLIKELTLTITALDRQGNPVEVYYQGPASGGSAAPASYFRFRWFDRPVSQYRARHRDWTSLGQCGGQPDF